MKELKGRRQKNLIVVDMFVNEGGGSTPGPQPIKFSFLREKNADVLNRKIVYFDNLPWDC